MFRNALKILKKFEFRLNSQSVIDLDRPGKVQL